MHTVHLTELWDAKYALRLVCGYACSITSRCRTAPPQAFLVHSSQEKRLNTHISSSGIQINTCKGMKWGIKRLQRLQGNFQCLPLCWRLLVKESTTCGFTCCRVDRSPPPIESSGPSTRWSPSPASLFISTFSSSFSRIFVNNYETIFQCAHVSKPNIRL